MPAKPPDKDRVARIVADAKVLGDDVACKKHGISRKTLTRYRKRSEAVPEVSQKVQENLKPLEEAQTQLTVTWMEEAEAVRRKLLNRVVHLAELSEDLHDVTGAYKIVNDGILAERAVGALDDAEDEEDGGRAGQRSGVATEGRQVEEAARRAGTKLAH